MIFSYTHLSISGHAETNEPLIELRGLSPRDIERLILEDILLHPVFYKDETPIYYIHIKFRVFIFYPLTKREKKL